MKTIRGRVLILISIVAIAVLLPFFRKSAPQNSKQEPPLPPLIVKEETPAPEQTAAQTKRSTMPQSFTKRAADMTEDEKAKLAKDFKERYKPVVEKWFKAYDGRIPFHEEDFTLDKFHSRLGNYMYTFMIGDTTFTIQDSKGVAKVIYLMTRKAAKEMNQLPSKGFVPNITVPITREDVIRMVNVDSGVEFKPNEVIIRPTAISCALNGGAFVELLPTGADPNNGLSSKIDLVFGPDGKLVNYDRDPFF